MGITRVYATGTTETATNAGSSRSNFLDTSLSGHKLQIPWIAEACQIAAAYQQDLLIVLIMTTDGHTREVLIIATLIVRARPVTLSG